MALTPFDGTLDAEPTSLQPFSGSLDGEKPKKQDNPLVRGLTQANSARKTFGALATGDYEQAAKLAAERDTYQRANPGSPEGNELMAAWEKGDGIVGGIKGVAGEMAKDWREAPTGIAALQATGKNLAAMGGGIVEQVPNMIMPMAGMLAGGAAGSLAGPAGTVAGAFAGAATGNTAAESSEQVDRAIRGAGIDPQNTQAVRSFLEQDAGGILGKSAIKGGIIGAVDTATMGIGSKVLNAPVRAATDRAIASLGIDAADKAAVSAARQQIGEKVIADPIYQASQKGAQAIARNLGVAALEPTGEFAGEYLGQGVATGDWDTKGAMLEALSSLGQSGITYAGQKIYQYATNPTRGINEKEPQETAPTVPDGVSLTADPVPVQQRIDAMLGLDTARMDNKGRALYEQDLAAAFNEPIGTRLDENQNEVPYTMGEYLDAQVSVANAKLQSTDRLAQLADEEAQQHAAITQDLVRSASQGGALSKAALTGIQTGATQMPAHPERAAIQQQMLADEAAQAELAPIERLMRTRTDEQVQRVANNESANPKMRQAAIVEIQRRMTTQAQPTTTAPLQQKATQFNLPENVRAAQPAQMAQAPKEANDAPTRIEQGATSQARIKRLQAQLEQAEPFTEQSSALADALQTAVSDDAKTSIDAGEMPVYKVTDHVSVAIHPSAQNPGMVQVTRYTKDGVIGDSQYNNIDDAVRQEGLTHKPRIAPGDAMAIIEKSIQAEAEYQQRKAEKADQQTDGKTNSVTNVTQRNPAPSNNQSKAAKAKKLKLSGNLINDLKVLGVDPGILARISTDGIRATESIKDLGEVAQQLRDYGYIFDDVNNSASQGLEEYLRKVSAGEASPLSASRIEDDIAERDAYLYKQSVNERAAELGLKKIGGKRKMEQVVADIEAKEAEIAAKEKEIAELEAREERAAIQASVIADEIYQEGSELTEADLMQWLGTQIEYSQDEINEADSRSSEIESRRAEANAGYDSEEQAQGGRAERAGTGADEGRTKNNEGFDLTAQTNEQAAAELARQKADIAEQKRQHDELIAKAKREANAKEKARRAAQVLAEREAAKKAEVNKAAEDFALGQAAPAPVDRRVSTEDARGQQDIFQAAPATNGEIPVAQSAQDNKPAAKGEDGDWLGALFNQGTDSTEEDANEVAQAVDKSARVDAAIAMLTGEIEATNAVAAELAARKYKSNLKQIELAGDGPGKNGSMSISAINESRRRRSIEAAQNTTSSMKKAIEFISENPDGAFKQVLDMESAVTKQFNEGFFGKSAKIEDRLDMAVGSLIGASQYSGIGSAGRKLRMAAHAYFSDDKTVEQPKPAAVNAKKDEKLKKGTVLYHGTQGKFTLIDSVGTLFLTTSKNDAIQFGIGIVPGHERTDDPRLVEIVVTEDSKVKDINSSVEDALMNDDDVDSVIVEESKVAKSEGYDFVHFKHPSIDGGDMDVWVSTNSKNIAIKNSFAKKEAETDDGIRYSKAQEFTPDSELIEAAKKHFMVTHDVREAGYILPDGTMLDFSGKHYANRRDWPYLKGVRNVDHRELTSENTHTNSTLDKYFDAKDPSDIMQEFMVKTGAMRVDFNAGVSSIMRPPTAQQIRAIGGMKGWSATSYVDPDNGRIVADIEFENTTPAKVKAFFEKNIGKKAGKDSPLFSNAATDATQSESFPRAQAESRIKSILGDKLGKVLIESGIVTFTNKGNEYQGATYKDGSIVLNLDALNADNFDGVFAHEGFHSTIRNLVGEETYAKLMKQLETMHAMSKSAQWVNDANAAIPSNTKEENRIEELAAYSIEQYVNGAKQPNIIKRWVESFMSALRTAIIRHIPNGRLKLWAVKNIQPQDLANLAIAGLKAKAQGQLQAQGREEMAYSRNEGVQSTYGLPNEQLGNRAFDRAELQALRRAAARMERPEAGITFHISQNGTAIATGPKGVRVPERYIRFANDNGLAFEARRLPIEGGTKAPAMPDTYRADGALYFGEMESNARLIDRTGKTRFSKINQTDTPANPDIRYSRAQIIGDSGRQYDQNQRQFFKNVGRDIDKKNLVERTTEYLKNDFWKKMAVGIVDQFRGLRDLGDNGQAYMLARLSKGTAGAFDALLHHGKLSIRDGVYDADTSGGFIERLGEPLHGELDDFLWYVAANRAEGLSRVDRENLFTPADIAAGKSLAQGQTDFDYTIQTGPQQGTTTRNRTLIYADANRVFNEFQKNALDMAEQSGLIDSASRKLWESEFYVPFYRVSEEDGEFIGAKMGNALVRQQAFKKLKGGTDKLNSDLLSNTLLNFSHLIEASAKNRAAKASLAAAEQIGVAERVAPDMASYTASNGSMLPPGTKGTVWFQENGKKVEYKVTDPFVMTAITSLEYAGMRNGVMDVMTKFKHWLTIGVTASPAFKVRNLIRDSIQSIGASDLSYNPIKNIAEGYKQTKRDSREYVSALASGGLIRFGTMLEGSESSRVRQLVKAGVKDSTILNSENKWRAFYDQYIDPAVSAYNELGNRSEEINRAALYNQLIKQGKSHAEAALLARDLMDFSMQGSFNTIRFLTQIVPFMNARLQGLYKLGRSAKDNPKKLAVVTGAVALASIGLMLAYGDDDDWKRREDWDRDNFWWFKFGGVEFRIPKPFEVGAVASLAERGLELMIDDEMTGERFRRVVNSLIMNNLSMNPIPQAFKPILDLYSNKDSFTGRPIESMSMQRLDPTERFNSNTSMIARGMSNASFGALSPVQIDHLARGYFGWLGSFVIGGADMAFRSVSDEPTKPALDYFKFATQGILKESGTGSSRYVTQLYEQAAELEQAHATYRQMLKDGRIDEAKEYAEDNKDKLVRYRQVEPVKKMESKLNERIRKIERSDMGSDEKKDAIALINKQKEMLAKRIAAGAN